MKGYRHLTLVDRCTIEEGREKGLGLASIAKLLGVHKSTISREIKRNSNMKGNYNAVGANDYANGRKMDTWNCKHKLQGSLEAAVVEKLEHGWSPEQISGRMRLEGKDSVCHETIYRWAYRNFDSKELKLALRRFKSRRRRKNKRQNRYIKIHQRKFIDHRPMEANERTVLGHWERDLMEGKRSTGSVLTIVERKSQYTLLLKSKSKTADEVNQLTLSAIKANKKLPFKTITNDNGPEFGRPQELIKKANIPIYFSHPHCPWERGSVENMNGLLRQYFPKRESFLNLQQKDLEWAQKTLNTRPRKQLGYRTPEEVMLNSKQKLINTNKFYKKKYFERELKSYLEFLKLAGVKLH